MMKLLHIKNKHILLVLCCLCIEGTLTSQIKKGPYLLYNANNTQLTVNWQLTTTQSCLFKWGITSSCNDGSATTNEINSGIDGHQHKYTITASLIPGTKYYYKVIDNNGSGTTYSGSFYSLPSASSVKLKYLGYGDTRTNPSLQNTVCAQMLSAISADPDCQTFLLHVGDWVSDGSSENYWRDEFFNRTYLNNINVQANLAIQGAKGNHENFEGDLLKKYWSYNYPNPELVPDITYYSFDYGPVHVSVLDQYTDYSIGSTQYSWLENDLSTSTKIWKVIVLHSPGYTDEGASHPNNTLVQELIQPLCETYGVQLVLGGDNHIYARCLINNVHHLTIGGGGAPLHPVGRYGEGWVTSESTLHFVKFTINGTNLNVTVYRPDGSTIESFNIYENFDATNFTFSNTSSLHTGGHTGAYYAANTITAITNVNIQAGTGVSFVAGNNVLLKTGFHAYSSSNFYAAKIAGNLEGFKNAKTSNSLITQNEDSQLKQFETVREIKFYPNPNNGKFTIYRKGDTEEPLLIEIYNVTGSLIYKLETYQTQTVPIDISDKPNGMYIMRVIQGNIITNSKILKK